MTPARSIRAFPQLGHSNNLTSNSSPSGDLRANIIVALQFGQDGRRILEIASEVLW
jgi:hypothetical protein